MTIAMGLALMAQAALSAGDRTTLDTVVAGIYAPYRRAEVDSTPPWERPIWSAEVRALIAQWQRVMPKDEVDALNDGDWLCQCQEFDDDGFRVVPLGARALPGGSAEVRLRVEIGFGENRLTRLVMKREAGGWRLDDFYGADFPKGLKQKLRETIREDQGK